MVLASLGPGVHGSQGGGGGGRVLEDNKEALNPWYINILIEMLRTEFNWFCVCT